MITILYDVQSHCEFLSLEPHKHVRIRANLRPYSFAPPLLLSMRTPSSFSSATLSSGGWAGMILRRTAPGDEAVPGEVRDAPRPQEGLVELKAAADLLRRGLQHSLDGVGEYCLSRERERAGSSGVREGEPADTPTGLRRSFWRSGSGVAADWMA